MSTFGRFMSLFAGLLSVGCLFLYDDIMYAVVALLLVIVSVLMGISDRLGGDS